MIKSLVGLSISIYFLYTELKPNQIKAKYHPQLIIKNIYHNHNMSLSYDYLTSSIKVSVPSFKENKAEKDAVYFTVEVESRDNKWYMEKRFSEFDNLSKGLKNSYHNLPNLPAKSFLFKMKDKDLEERR